MEYFAPYLMKEGTVQKVQYFTEDVDPEAKVILNFLKRKVLMGKPLVL